MSYFLVPPNFLQQTVAGWKCESFSNSSRWLMNSEFLLHTICFLLPYSLVLLDEEFEANLYFILIQILAPSKFYQIFQYNLKSIWSKSTLKEEVWICPIIQWLFNNGKAGWRCGQFGQVLEYL